MPNAANPNKREFYVYRLQVGNAPFYVGIGRAGRAPDRVPYVQRKMRRQRKGQAVTWSPHARVIARLLRAGFEPREIREVRVLQRVSQKTALAREPAEITRLARL